MNRGASGGRGSDRDTQGLTLSEVGNRQVMLETGETTLGTMRNRAMDPETNAQRRMAAAIEARVTQ